MSEYNGFIHKEVIIFLCSEHFEFDMEVTYPGFKFNYLPIFHSNKCEINGCLNEAFYRCIGVKIPDTCPDLTHKNPILAPDEIYLEAVKALVGGAAIDKLTSFLYYKTRTYVYDSGDFCAVVVVKQLAKLLLKELSIDENHQMSARQVSQILKYLKLYPIDYLEAYNQNDRN